jgi:3-dehydroquinate synthase
MIKHGLIKSPVHLDELKHFDLDEIDYDLLEEIIQHSVDIKKYFVANDLTEKNIRKALNFGHTAGHAFESLAMEQARPILHGFAVAFGMITELYLSVYKCHFDKKVFDEITNLLLKIYGNFSISDKDFDKLFELMMHDKKNESGRINFALLSDVGKIEINQNCEKELIKEAFQYFQKIAN